MALAVKALDIVGQPPKWQAAAEPLENRAGEGRPLERPIIAERLPLRCSKCSGNLYLEPIVPGVWDVLCLACGNSEGEATTKTLGAEGVPEHVLTLSEAVPLSYMWTVEEFGVSE